VKTQTTKKRTVKKTAATRELISPRGDKRYIRRDDKGQSKKAMTSPARCHRTAAARPRARRRSGRAIAATANPQTHYPSGERRVPAGNATLNLFGEAGLPEGMKYRADFLAVSDEQALLGDVQGLPFREFEFHGFTGKRKTVSFGWRYDFYGGLSKTDDMPEFLTSLRPGRKSLPELRPAVSSRFS
jgi:hypothetical protein